jgi:putative ABC transport system ATP-binding protein
MNINKAVYSLQGVGVSIGETILLSPVNLQIEQGDFLTIAGPSGSGKSTLLQVLLGFTEPTMGSVFFEGQLVGSKILPYLRSQLAVVFQEPVLAGDTVLSALQEPFTYKANAHLQWNQKSCDVLLEQLGLQRVALNDTVKNLSGGEKQRLALIRALMLGRPILLLDEVTSALDGNYRDIVQNILLERQITVIAVSHDTHWIANSPKVFTLGSKLDIFASAASTGCGSTKVT